MKKILLTVCFAVVFGLGGCGTDTWSDSADLYGKSPAESVIEEYVEYKWDYAQNAPKSEEWNGRREFNRENIPLPEDMVDFDIAGYTACSMLDRLFPNEDVPSKTFYGYLLYTPYFNRYTASYRFAYVKPKTSSDNSRQLMECAIDIKSGICLQVITIEQESMDDKPDAKDTDELTESEREEMLKKALTAAEITGFANAESYYINKSLDHKGYYVYFETEDNKTLRYRLGVSDEGFYFTEFLNETDCGYKMKISEEDKIMI